MIWRATDLGRIKSVATIPAISTHQQQGEVGRTLANVPGNLIRLSVGGEHPSDIMADLDQAFVRQIGRRPDTVRMAPSAFLFEPRPDLFFCVQAMVLNHRLHAFL